MKKGVSRVRLFQSDFLEQFTHVHPLVPLFMWSPVIAYLYHLTFTVTELSIFPIIGWSLTGLFVWTLTEYIFHRFAFHFPAESKMGKRFVYMMHGLHHDDPNDGTRLVMPPVPAIIYSSLLYFTFRAFIGPEAVLPFFATFLVGYLVYDYTHYYVHHFTPTTTLGKFLKKHHMTHHFQNHEANWGVSSPLWDFLMNTIHIKGERNLTMGGTLVPLASSVTGSKTEIDESDADPDRDIHLVGLTVGQPAARTAHHPEKSVR